MSIQHENVCKLTKEQWIAVATSFIETAETICCGLQKVKDHDPMIINTSYDPDVYAENVKYAVAAIAYVSEYAADKCFFVVN